MDNELSAVNINSSPASPGAIEHFRLALAAGRHWYIALLEAMGLWTSAGEEHEGRRYNYLIEGEAFDWLVLAERLCREVDGLLPEAEKLTLLFGGEPPVELEPGQFENLIGASKYRQYLNFFYGVIVEEALVMAVQEEVRKERHCLGFCKDPENFNEAYRRVYGSTRAILMKHFRKEKSYPQVADTSLTELKEFTYWCFHYRIRHSEKARVASDTRKALDYLKRCGIRHPASAYVQRTGPVRRSRHF